MNTQTNNTIKGYSAQSQSSYFNPSPFNMLTRKASYNGTMTIVFAKMVKVSK